MDPSHPDQVAIWLGEVFGGPKKYTAERGGYAHMVRQHVNRALTEAQRARWVQLMGRATDDAGLPTDPEFRSAFVSYLEWGSRLAQTNSQPGATPPMRMTVPRWDWGTAGPPGHRPIGPPDDIEEEAATVVPLPDPGEPISFAAHIKPLFRPVDRQSMRWAFDLWSHDDVAAHAPAVLARIEAGTMPCDVTWPKPQISALRDWIETGMAEKTQAACLDIRL